MFIDHIRIFSRAGDGGNGVISFRREKFVPRGGPDGGDGGDGGKVILQVDQHTDDLRSYHYDPKLLATGGQAGGGARKHGKNGRTVIGKIPPGTLVWKTNASSMAEASELQRTGSLELTLVTDLTKVGEEFILCQGGKGGLGNWHFRTPTNQAPRECTLGTEGEVGVFYLELRRIADIGLVGFPNAGKSTLLRELSNAKPKVANYPFTTLQPMVGVIEFDQFRRCTMADIPGLIEGAHANRGLGHEFLRHITRCGLLLFIVDISGSEGRNPIEDIEKLRTEISLYSKELSQRQWMIVANKIDMPEAEVHLDELKNRFPNIEILTTCAELGEGLPELKERLNALIGHKVLEEQTQEPVGLEHRPLKSHASDNSEEEDFFFEDEVE